MEGGTDKEREKQHVTMQKHHGSSHSNSIDVNMQPVSRPNLLKLLSVAAVRVVEGEQMGGTDQIAGRT